MLPVEYDDKILSAPITLQLHYINTQLINCAFFKTLFAFILIDYYFLFLFILESRLVSIHSGLAGNFK